MTPDEIDNITKKLTAIYPGKYGDDELLDLVNRLANNPGAVVERAIDEHRNTARFKPTPAELFAIIRRQKAASAGEAASSPTLDGSSFADIMRRQNNHLRGLPDAFVLWVHARSCWRRHRQLHGDKPAERERIDRRWQADLERDLIGHGYDAAESGRTSEWVSSDDVAEIVQYLKGGGLQRAAAQAEAA